MSLKIEEFGDIANNLVNELHSKGYVICDDFFSEEYFSRLFAEYQQLESEAVTQIAPGTDGIVPKTQEFPIVEEVKHFLTFNFMELLDQKLQSYNPSEHKHTSYYHHYNKLKTFMGYKGAQIRIRTHGDLGMHIDRTSAELTLLFYLNGCESGGELKILLLPEEEMEAHESSKDWAPSAWSCCTRTKLLEVKKNQLVLFWSDCVPHEVMPFSSTRSVLQIFYSSEKPLF